MLDKVLIEKIIQSAIIALCFIIIYIIISTIINKLANIKLTKIDLKRKKTTISLIDNIIKYFFVVIAGVMILEVFDIETSAILASLGAVSLVVGLSLQDILKDILAGLSIIFENQFNVGDIISVGDLKGEVQSIGVKTTKVKGFNGEVIIFPNRNIGTVINHSINSSVASVNVQISYSEDVNKVEKILSSLCEKLSNELELLTGNVTLLGVTELGNLGVNFKITAEVEPTRDAEVARQILKEVKIELDKNNITIPSNIGVYSDRI